MRLPTQWLGVAPFFIFAIMFLILPTLYLMLGAFQNDAGEFTLENIVALAQPSIVAAGMDPDNLPQSDASKMSFGTDASGERAKPKAWKEIWGSGQGIGSLDKVVPAAELIARLKKEYDEATDPPL